MSLEIGVSEFTDRQKELSLLIAQMLHSRIGILLNGIYGYEFDSYERHNRKVLYGNVMGTFTAQTALTSTAFGNTRLQIVQKSHEWPTTLSPEQCNYDMYGHVYSPRSESRDLNITNTVGVLPIMPGFVSCEKIIGSSINTIYLPVSEESLEGLVGIIETGQFEPPSNQVIGMQ